MRLNGIWVGVAALSLAACGGGEGGDNDMATPQAADEASEPSLLGKWMASDDPLSTLTITETEISFAYEGNTDGYELYSIEQGCPTAPQAPFEDDTIVTAPDGGEDGFCYAIDTLEADRLVLIYLPRGNALEYVRPE